MLVQGRMSTRRDQIGHGFTRAITGDQALSNQHGASTRTGVGEDVVRPANP